MSAIRVEIESFVPNKRLNKWCQEARSYLSIPLMDLKQVNFYKIASPSLSQDELKNSIISGEEGCAEVFFDPILQKLHLDSVNYQFSGESNYSFVVEVSFKPGVTDNPAHTTKEALALFGHDLNVASGKIYFLYGDLSELHAEVVAQDLLANPLIESIRIFTKDDFNSSNRFEQAEIATPQLQNDQTFQEINLNDCSDQELMEISNSRCLALTISEMKHIRDYYQEKKIVEERKKSGLPLNPTDVEIEVFAQTWSEHCKHKIFSSNISYSEDCSDENYPKVTSSKIKSLYKTFIKGATKSIEEKRKIDWLISVFSDNAGIVRFDSNIDLCIKAETHNSPSALDPYGGSLTGILGVNRDILGCGLGARPIANTDVFCFAPPHWPSVEEKDQLPKGLKHPRRIFEGVHLGIEDGGNKSGIPTVNGAIYFDQDYAGKPLVFCGTVGSMPQKIKDSTPSHLKLQKPSDRVVMVGGAIGHDGIHGATFSSMELNESSPVSAVQIGDPLTQKRVLDFLIEARDLELYSSVTDNGAGGLSSSVGEMAIQTNGAHIDLALCPVKYPGLTPYELFISESQERMTFAVPPEKIDSFLELAKRRGVDATDIGYFNDSGNLSIYFGEQKVGVMDMYFLHDSLPSMELKASWDGPRPRTQWMEKEKQRVKVKEENSLFIEEILLKVLQTPNVVSKESWVRRYDHEVQAATHIKPFCGQTSSGPSDSGVVWLYPHGGEKENAVSIGCGLNPRISLFDSYFMAQFAVDEAIRNVVSSGGDINTCCLLDNFCWPDPVQTERNPDGDYKLGQLVRACSGLYDICCSYGTPLVSGKDSMKNDFRGKNNKGTDLTISILPTLLVTAMSKTQVKHTVTTDFKQKGDLLYLVGKSSKGLLGSEFAELINIENSSFELLPKIDITANKNLYETYFNAVQKDLISSCHDLSDGGLLVSIAESMIGGNLGAKIQCEELNNLENTNLNISNFLFNEGPGRFLVSISPSKQKDFEKHFSDIDIIPLGNVTSDQKLIVTQNNLDLVNLPIERLTKSWKMEL